jgi:hypothetical protein
MLLATCALLLVTAQELDEIDESDVAVRAAIDGGIAFLLETQNEDGSWGGSFNATFTSGFADLGTYHSWAVGTTALAALALLDLGEGPEVERAADAGLDFLVANKTLVRPAEWDVDNVWGLVYGLDTLSKASMHPRYAETERGAVLHEAAQTMVAGLEKYASPKGGWGYYSSASTVWQPEWATSFTTAVGVLALVAARDAGIEVPDKLFDATVRSVRHCRQPNGAYTYSVNVFPRHLSMESINQVKGSLGRIQVCNLALERAGSILPEGAMHEGVEQFFRNHQFLDLARNKPIPHEGYYAVAAYFYLFGHYYASATIASLPEDVAKEYRLRLRHEVLKCKQKDGSFWDFWIASSTKAYGTSFAIMSLARTLPADS